MRSMFAPVSAIRPAMAATAAGFSGMPEHGHVAAALGARAGCRRCPGRPRRSCRARRRPAPRASRSAFQSRGAVTRTPEHQPAAQHDLLDVEHLDAERPRGSRRPSRSRRPVLAGQRDQQGLRRRRRRGHVGAEASGPRRHEQAATRPRLAAWSRGARARAAGASASHAVTLPPSSSRARSTIVRHRVGQRRQAYGARGHRRRGSASRRAGAGPSARRRPRAASGRRRGRPARSVVRSSAWRSALVGLRRVGHLPARTPRGGSVHTTPAPARCGTSPRSAPSSDDRLAGLDGARG